MFGTLKRKGLSWSVIISLSTLFISCEEAPVSALEIQGDTQGTTYSVIVVGDDIDLTKKELDSVLHEFDLSLSTYMEESVISQLNASNDTISIEDETGFLETCYRESQAIYDLTNGQFDPSVFPLVKGWGFMNDLETPLTQIEIDSLLNFVSFEQDKLHSLYFERGASLITMKKHVPEFKMDFNAIAQGLSVDVLYAYIEAKGYKNFFVEIGGELKVKGKNKDGVKWKIAIDSPIENLQQRQLDTVVHISNRGIATSGNYRKFYVKDGIKYSHTLNPKTGKPVTHSLLSATVIADRCSSADGYATAFMVMGTEKALQFVKQHTALKLEVYLLYADENGEIQHRMSDGFSNYLK